MKIKTMSKYVSLIHHPSQNEKAQYKVLFLHFFTELLFMVKECAHLTHLTKVFKLNLAYNLKFFKNIECIVFNNMNVQ